MKNPIDNFINKHYPEGNVTQYFGENPELYSKAVCVGGDCLQGHNGVDIVAPWGTPIFAIEGGKIVDVKDTATGYGKHIRILSGQHEWTYGHLSRIDVKVGQIVKDGGCVGLMGNTGFVVSGATPYWKYNPYAGTHVHIGMRIFKHYTGSGTWNITYPTGDRGNIKDWDNGYWGSIDWIKTWRQKKGDENLHIKGLQLTVIALSNQVIGLLQKLIKLKNNG